LLLLPILPLFIVYEYKHYAPVLNVTQTFSMETAIQLLMYERVSYCPEDTILNWTCGTNCASLQNITDVVTFYN